jgi:transposase, IS30 family
MGYSHFSIDEREGIARMRYAGVSMREIGRQLGRSPSSVSRELSRNTKKSYYGAHAATVLYVRRRHRASSRLRHWPDGLISYAMAGLQRRWSPEQVSGRLKLDHPNSAEMRISFATLYRWIRRDRAMGGSMHRLLRRKGRSYRKARGFETRGRFNGALSIRQRPGIVARRGRFGDWEADTVYGFDGKTCIATFNERKSLYLISRKMPRPGSEALREAAIASLGGLRQGMRMTMTVDRGSEFACYRDLKNMMGIDVYFADPYCSWQRGQNENLNGLLRQYFPKGIDFNTVTQEALDRVVDEINSRPRKTLDYRAPAEVAANARLLHLA